jgi:gamma-glutamyl hydrolase
VGVHLSSRRREAAAVTSSPIIGILGLPENESKRRHGLQDSGRSSFEAYYAHWLYQAGARVVPLRYNMSDAEIAFFGTRLNGIVFTGGDLVLEFNSTYVLTAQKWLNVALKNPDLHIWGTCQGFQLLHVLVANSPRVMCLECFDSEDISWPLNFTDASSDSFYVQLSFTSRIALSTKNITMNFHHDGVEPKQYASGAPFPELAAFFNVLSTNVDRKGREFVSSVQGKHARNIIGVQYHPERQAFEFSDVAGDAGLVHTREAIMANNELGVVFVENCRESRNAFDSWDQAAKFLLYNYQPVYQGQSEQLYFY